MSYVERDRLSMDELWQQLQVHYLVVEGQLLHWLFPGKQLHEGLMLLYEENVETMSKQITDCGVVDIYVEDPVVDNKEASDWEVEDEEYNDGADEEENCGDDVEEPAGYVRTSDFEDDCKKENAEGEDNSDDSDFVPADSSSDDEEVVAIRENYKKFKEEKMEEEKLLSIECAALNEVKEEVEEDSNEDDESYDEDSDGQIVSKDSHYARYNNGRKLTLGMKLKELWQS